VVSDCLFDFLRLPRKLLRSILARSLETDAAASFVAVAAVMAAAAASLVAVAALAA